MSFYGHQLTPVRPFNKKKGNRNSKSSEQNYFLLIDTIANHCKGDSFRPIKSAYVSRLDPCSAQVLKFNLKIQLAMLTSSPQLSW